MAIETSTQGTINSLLSAVPSAGGNSTSNTAEEAATTSQSLPSMFAALLSNEEASNDETSETSSSQSSTSTSQFDTSLLSNLVTDDAISLMQNQLLGALQNNVFAALTAAASTSSTDTAAQSSSSTAPSTTVEAASTETDLPTTSMFDSMMTSAFGEDGLGLQDGFDTLNIVNHLPVVSDIYEATTSSHIAAASSMAGSFLYGGLGGLLYNAVDLTVEGLTGKSISNNLWDAGKQIINGNAPTETTDENSLMVDEADGETSSTAASDVYEFVRRQVSG
ncbi:MULTISPECIES: hypothetical protein [Alteromonas]|jgi:hypothetical protein|uniref:Uncharacterized protein n=1 Tax=Alteromonas stellipolaris TaxID=233316 RepID=A0AAW7Z639_9ALTE|nr:MULTISPECIES: hypothetical protein [Alteromonas]AMJ89386.1 hypothetical protein AV940_02210 [Alteromonas sp. Mac2]ALM92077.1 hypothetical protein AOR13_3076 [Alteromonas stellipolaris LMG 21856]AMJ73106.1 hypothetical protein AVL57_03395 [Alteromonas stellipolaris]AMJ85498.1 hypothetical protein AV939_02210 [Alteromonas sp. Mac1]AMJ93216.1 hypothetical protein AVL56_02120 [Alteromonas stellipolaris]